MQTAGFVSKLRSRLAFNMQHDYVESLVTLRTNGLTLYDATKKRFMTYKTSDIIFARKCGTDIRTCVTLISQEKMPLRKCSEVWAGVDEQRIAAGEKTREWQRSYDGVKTALLFAGLTLVTTLEEFQVLPIPTSPAGIKLYTRRNIVVSRGNKQSPPASIDCLMTGNCNFLDEDEKAESNKKMAAHMKEKFPVGGHISNTMECNGIDALDDMIDAADVMHKEHLYEFRLADVAYCMLGNDIASDTFLAEQTKTACASEEGRVAFGGSGDILNVGGIISILENHMSLCCIGMTSERKVEVVWFFHGPEAIAELSAFLNTQRFTPRLHRKLQRSNKFTDFYSQTVYRFDIGQSESERTRLLQRRLTALKTSVLRSLIFLNEDDSQIPGEYHRREQLSFAMTRAACATHGVLVKRLHEDSYGSVDFRVGQAEQFEALKNSFCCKTCESPRQGPGRKIQHEKVQWAPIQP